MIQVYIFSLVLSAILLAASLLVVGALKSLRFWMLSTAFFGMTGLALDGLDLVSPPGALFAAVAIGIVVGASVRLFSA